MNSRERDLRKAAEECSELATVLIQQLNKPRKNLTNEITEEIGDVLFRLENLEKHFDSEAIEQRVLSKKQKEKSKFGK